MALRTPLRVDESKLYDAEYREKTLNEITNALLGDGRITGALLVGSGAKGYRDRYSDIDLAVLVAEEEQLEVIYEDWWGRLHGLLPVIDAFKEPSRHLIGLLLDRYMELDIGFQSTANLFERKSNWRILFDRHGAIPDLMKPREKAAVDQAAAHDKRMQDSWYYIIHAVSSIQRGQPLRASFFIGFLRDEAILMAGLSRGMDKVLGATSKRPIDSPRKLGSG